MRLNKPEKIGLWITVGVALIIALLTLLEIAMPGSVLTRIRRTLGKAGMDMELAELSSGERMKAQAMAEEWKAGILRQHPEFQVAAREIADEENGYLQLLLLKNQPEPDPRILESWKLFENNDVAEVEAALHASGTWLAEVQRVANLQQRSNAAISSYEQLPDVACIKRAAETLILQSWVQASHRDELGALQSMASVHQVLMHVIDLECPFILSELIVVLIVQKQHEAIFDQILPHIGPQADLSAWRQILEQHPPSVERFRAALIGEWQAFANLFVVETLFGAHLQRDLVDPHETADAITRHILEMARNLETDDIKALETFDNGLSEPDLSPEGMQWFETYSLGGAFAKGYIRAIRLHARSIAAIELLMLEREQGSLAPADATRVTKDPYTGDPFILNVGNRSLSCPSGKSIHTDYDEHKPLKLPW